MTTWPGTVGFGEAAINASVGLPVETIDTGACVGCTSVLCAAEGGITTWPGTVGFGEAAISASVGLPVDTIDTGA